MRRGVLLLVLFAVLMGFFAIGLTLNPREVPSPLIGKPAPVFSLPRLDGAVQTFAPQDMLGQVWLLNVWASWCAPCRQEHSLLVELSKTRLVPILGLDYKDQRNDGLEWLHEAGDPYTLSVSDIQGRVSVDYGVYGVPETFVIDKKGIIRFKQIGVITQEILQTTILPLVKELNG